MASFAAMKLLAPFILLLAISSMTAQISSPDRFRAQIFDVLHYDANITFPDPPTRRIDADVKITVQWQIDAEAPTFPFHLRGLTIDSVFVNGSRAAWSTIGTPDMDTMHHRVQLARAVTRWQRDTIRVFYRGVMTNEGGSSPWGGVHYQDQVLYSLGVGFANNYVSTTQHWLACYDHPSDKATFTGRFRVPTGGWVVASVGPEQPAKSVDTLVEYTWVERNQIATYLITFAVGKYTSHRLQDLSGKNIPHVFYYLPRDQAKSIQSYSLVPQMTAHLSSWFGDYPFDKVGYCNTYKGAMEHQSMISMPVATIQRGDTMNVTGAHELAHQWFGDFVTPIDFRYAWLTESFATFSEALWIEHKRGWDAYLKELEVKTRSAINVAKQEGVFALEAFPRKAPSSNYPQTIYQKGAVVVGMMRAIAGDEAFKNGLQYYLRRSDTRYGNAQTETMAESLRSALGKRTYDFFNEWVTGKGWAKLRVEQRKSDNGILVTIQQVQKQQFPDWPLFTTLPLNVTYINVSGNKEDRIVFPDDQGVIEFECLELLGVNSGSKSRCMCEVQSISSVDETDASESITLAPIPASDRLIVTRRGSGEREYAMTIYDARGAAMRSWTDTMCENGCVIDVSSYPIGAYILVVTFGNRTSRLPFTVTRGE